MTLEGTPWFVNGAAHGPEVARTVAFLAAGGHGGVVAANDFKVTASTIPDGNVHIAPGSIAAVNRGEGGRSQAYVGRNVGDHVKSLTAQGASGVRYDLVAYVVHDPQYAGQPAPDDVETGPYDDIAVYQGVSEDTRFLTDVDADQTGEALALIKFDASDGTITNADITDLRRLVTSRSETVMRMNTITTGTGQVSSGSAATFPSGAVWSIFVPSWANSVALFGSVSGVDTVDAGGDTGTAAGTVHVELGTLATPTGRWKGDATGAGKHAVLSMQAAEDNIAVPEAMRGRAANLRIRAAKTGGTGLTVQSADGTTAVAMAVFSEKPV
jgi:hypothetical protein